MIQKMENVLELEVTDGTEPVDFTGATSILLAISQKQRGVYIELPVDVQDGKLVCTLPYKSAMRLVSATLTAAGWDANAKTQTVSVAGVTAGTNGSLRIAQSATDDQFTAWGAAQPRVTAQADGSITVKLAGTVPTMDIPVEVLIV